MSLFGNIIQDYGLRHSGTRTHGAKVIDSYLPDHHWKTGVEVVTTTHKGRLDKYEWRALSGSAHGNSVESLMNFLKADHAKYEGMVSRHAAGTGEFKPNPGGLYGDAKTAYGYGYSVGEASGRHDVAGANFHKDSYRKWLSAYSFRQPIEVKREAEDAFAKGFAEAMEYRHRPNPGRGWFTRCMEGVEASGSAVDPGAVCGAQLKKMGRRRNPKFRAGMPIYNRQQWVLGMCEECGALNYVEPHGTTAYCYVQKKDTEHKNIPYEYRDMSGTRLMRRPPGSKNNPRRRHNATGAHGWPLVPSTRFPGEKTLACPKCGSTDVTMKAVYGPGGRLGDPGGGQLIKCESCGHSDYKSSKRNSRSRRRNPWTISLIKAMNKSAGQHFFDKDTMRFFNSHIYPTVYEGSDGVFFVTHEIFEGSDRVRQTQYKVRQFDPTNGHIHTHGPYLRSLKEAKDMARSLAGKKKNTRKRKNAGPWSIRKHKKALKKSGSGTNWQPGIRVTRPRRKPRSMSANPRRFTLRAAGREFTVLAKSMKAAWKEVNGWLKKQGLGLNPSGARRTVRRERAAQKKAGKFHYSGYSAKAAYKIRESAKRRARRERNAYEPGGHSKVWYDRGARAGKSKKYTDMYDAWGDYRGRYLAPGVSMGQKVTAQESFYQGYIDHASKANRRRRNRSVSMLSPRTSSRKRKAVESRTSSALARYVRSRRRY